LLEAEGLVMEVELVLVVIKIHITTKALEEILPH
jgi:hypothetical protein